MKVGINQTFSRHGIAQVNLALLIWLNENVGINPTFSRHGIAQVNLALLIWLNENVQFIKTIMYEQRDVGCMVGKPYHVSEGKDSLEGCVKE